MKYRGNILVAPLNWGLGHATRCIPLIRLLLKYKFNPIIASDGAALHLLGKEFPELARIELPSYNIRYTKNKHLIKVKMLLDSPRILSAIKAEKQMVAQIVRTYNISGIISDNRPGVFHKKIKSVFVTHQLKVKSGNTTWLTTAWHKNLIKRFDECWVPDYPGEYSLSGDLSSLEIPQLSVKYIGPLSRFDKSISKKTIDILIILSGPEPHRRILEERLLDIFNSSEKKIVMVKGMVEDKVAMETKANLTIYNFLLTDQLEGKINDSKLIISRSGYTSIMDYARLNKKVFFIPTPGQFEQEYLAKRMMDLKMAPYSSQHNFRLDDLDLVSKYNGLSESDYQYNFKNLFGFFEGK